MTVFPINRALKARVSRACSPAALPFTCIFYCSISRVKNFSTTESPTRPTAGQKIKNSGNEINQKNDVLTTRHRASIKFLDDLATPKLRAEFVQYCCR